jgi:hypothetical protein
VLEDNVGEAVGVLVGAGLLIGAGVGAEQPGAHDSRQALSEFTAVFPIEPSLLHLRPVFCETQSHVLLLPLSLQLGSLAQVSLGCGAEQPGVHELLQAISELTAVFPMLPTLLHLLPGLCDTQLHVLPRLNFQSGLSAQGSLVSGATGGLPVDR